MPYAQAGVGAIASQFETNPMYGPRGLALLASGLDPQHVLDRLLAQDGNFDGQGIADRQVGIVALDGAAVNYSGSDVVASPWTGAISGDGYSIQGNGLAGSTVVEQMQRAFLATTGSLAKRLLTALSAGDAAGGQSTGRQSAALLVRTPQGFPLDIDLRVDSSNDPVGDLRKLYAMQDARQVLVNARLASQRGDYPKAQQLLVAATAEAPQWMRIFLTAAKIAVQIEQPDLALHYLDVAFNQNPAWIDDEIGNGDYAELGVYPAFQRWVTPSAREAALRAYRASSSDALTLAARLLEVHQPDEAERVLARAGDTADVQSLRVIAALENGEQAKAALLAQTAAQRFPNDTHLRALAARVSAIPR